MKVKLKTAISDGTKFGDIVDMDPNTARRFVASGQAEYVNDKDEIRKQVNPADEVRTRPVKATSKKKATTKKTSTKKKRPAKQPAKKK